MEIMNKVKFDPDNPHIRTFTDKRFYFLNVLPESICIEDIAHSLAHTCRYGGHCQSYYSVAEHSIVCSNRVDRSVALWGLLHDAAEAYIGDLCKPLKSMLSIKAGCGCQEDISNYEHNILRVIVDKFGLSWPMPQEVIDMDRTLLYEEMEFLWSGTSWMLLDPLDAEQLFLSRFNDLIQ